MLCVTYLTRIVRDRLRGSGPLDPASEQSDDRWSDGVITGINGYCCIVNNMS